MYRRIPYDDFDGFRTPSKGVLNIGSIIQGMLVITTIASFTYFYVNN
jgi:hypothetical protein